MQTIFLRLVVLITFACGFSYAEDKNTPESKPNAETKPETGSKATEGEVKTKAEAEIKPKEEDQSEQAELKVEKKNENSSYSGEVFVLRNGPRTEVFFRKHNQSYFIPKGNKHNSIVKTLQKKAKLNQMVSIEFNPKTKEIVEVRDTAVETKPGNNAGASQ